MKVEDIIEGLNLHIEIKRRDNKIDAKGHLVMQKEIKVNPTFKAYKEYTVTIWLLNPKNRKKTAVLTYKKTDKFLDSNDKNLTLAEKEICTGIFSFCRQQGFEEVIEGTYGNINE